MTEGMVSVTSTFVEINHDYLPGNNVKHHHLIVKDWILKALLFTFFEASESLT
jgi:hypothetical protein